MQRPDHTQRGVVLLLLLLAVFMSGATLFLGAMNNRQSSALQQERELLRQMQQAKEALLAYAASNAFNFSAGPGLLPCPDINNTGLPNPGCDPTTQYLGRLPRYVSLPTLNLAGNNQRFYLNETYAGLDQQFWYAVSPAWIYSDHTNSEASKANSNIAGALTLDGASDIVAVLLAPGEALASQDRLASPLAYTAYLEGGNGSGFNFFSSYSVDPDAFNDRVLGISRAELMDAAVMVAARQIKTGLDTYWTAYPGQYPEDYEWWFGFPYQTTFRNAINNNTGNPAWVKSTSGILVGEQNWTGISSYDQINTSRVTLSFLNCGIVFTLDYTGNPGDNGISMSSSKC